MERSSDMTLNPNFKRSIPAGADEGEPLRPVHVWEVMSTGLLTTTPDQQVSEVWARARREDVHHVIVVHGSGVLLGMICVCDMERAWSDACVVDTMSSRPLFIGPGMSLTDAAETMERYGVGALPVLALDGRPLGVVTRSDLRRRGALPGRRGIDRCASCGAYRGLCPRGANDVCFCRACEEAAKQPLDHAVLGGEA
jgi:CBS domain-containing protein